MNIPATLKKLWALLKDKPFGKRVFSFLLSRMVPYSGSVSPYIESLEPGYCRVSLNDSRRLRNHLNSVHALALANLGEMASGLATISQLDESLQGIVTGLEIEYLKKARGKITAEARVKIPAVKEEKKIKVESLIFDAKQDLVAKMKVSWLIRGKGKSKSKKKKKKKKKTS